MSRESALLLETVPQGRLQRWAVRAPKPPGNPLRECPPAGCADLPLNFAAGIARWLRRVGWYLPELHNPFMNDLFDTPPAADPTDAVALAHYAERA